MTENDLIDFTPELRKRALEIANQYVMGPLFTPPSLKSTDPKGKKGTLSFPNAWGSNNWNTGAFDPETGIYYAATWGQIGSYGLSKATDPKATMAYWVSFDREEQDVRHENDDEVRAQPEPSRFSALGRLLTVWPQ